MQRLAAAAADRRTLLQVAAIIGGFAFAFAVGYVLVHPIWPSPIGYDTAGSVLYFERLVHGQVLEQPYGVTPKPAMTLIDGVLFRLHGWSAISLAAVAVFAAVVTLGAELARRVAGPVAAVFAYVALLGSQALLLDATLAYAVGWAALWLIVAGFAVSAERPRYLVVGLALLMATLTRIESIVVVAGAFAVVVGWRWLGPRFGFPRPPRQAWLVGLGFLAVPIMLAHDWLLIRNPMYWASVSAAYSAADPALRTPAQLVLWLGHHYAVMAVLTLLACAGGVVLVRRRNWSMAIGLGLLGPGIGLFLVLMAARGTYVSGRYLYLMDLAVTFAAAVGLAAVRLPELAVELGRRHARSIAALALLTSAAVAFGASAPFAPLDPATRRTVFNQVVVARNVRAVEPQLGRELAAARSAVRLPRVIAPGLWTPRVIVDLALRIPEVAAPHFTPDGSSYAPGSLRDGQLIYHDRVGDPSNGATAALESGGPVTTGPFLLTEVSADPAAGWWIYRVALRP